MPTLAQMEAATPKCPVVARTNMGGQTAGTRCGRPCRYDHGRNIWVCPTHDDVLAGEALAAVASGALCYREVA